MRFQNLGVEAEVFVGARNLPTVWNSYRNFFEFYLLKLRLMKLKKRKFVILDNLSGVLPPGRMCLLLGPPGEMGFMHFVDTSGFTSRLLKILNVERVVLSDIDRASKRQLLG